MLELLFYNIWHSGFGALDLDLALWIWIWRSGFGIRNPFLDYFGYYGYHDFSVFNGFMVIIVLCLFSMGG
jgi:hypothetical protein